MIFLTVPCICFFFVTFSNGQDANEISSDIRPYEFVFNVVDFQHRFEKKDDDGIITGEYGFITADGVYHETGYATDKHGDFIITKMRNRKLKSRKDIEEFFKGKPEVAKKLMTAIRRSCGDCNGVTNIDKVEDGVILNGTMENATLDAAFNGTENVPEKEETPNILSNLNDIHDVRKGKTVSKEDTPLENEFSTQDKEQKEKKEEEKEEKEKDEVLEASSPAGKNLSYRFNYSISSHGHNEEGYRNGRKDGKYHSMGEDSVDVKVEYVSNEFGHQPNVTIVPGPALNLDEEALKGFSFLWYRK